MVSPRRFDFPPLTQKSRSFTEDQRPRRKPAVSGKEYLFKKAEVIHRDSMFRFLDNHAVYVQRFNDLGTPRVRSNSRDRALFSRGLTPVKHRADWGRTSYASSHHSTATGGELLSEVRGAHAHTRHPPAHGRAGWSWMGSGLALACLVVTHSECDVFRIEGSGAAALSSHTMALAGH